jgi:hypothetical protein
MDDLVFRTKQEPTEQLEVKQLDEEKPIAKKESVAVVDIDKSKLPVTAWDAEYERPYSADYFDLGQAYDELSYENKENLKIINNYFLRQVRSGKIKATQENFDKVMGKIKSLLRVDDAPFITQVREIADYLKVMNKPYVAAK